MTMNRITFHHSGGGYHPNKTDLRAYHRLTDGEGRIHHGKFGILDNAPGRIRKGNYAAHTWKLNTGNIGSVICSMHGGDWADPFAGKFAVKPVQVDAFIDDQVLLCREYGITPSREHTLSHAEVQITLGVTQRNKWDFDYDIINRTATRDPIAIGDELRQEITLRLGGAVEPVQSLSPTLRRGSLGVDVEELQRLLALPVDGVFGPLTEAGVRRYQRRSGLLADGIVGRMTWASIRG